MAARRRGRRAVVVTGLAGAVVGFGWGLFYAGVYRFILATAMSYSLYDYNIEGVPAEAFRQLGPDGAVDLIGTMTPWYLQPPWVILVFPFAWAVAGVILGWVSSRLTR